MGIFDTLTGNADKLKMLKGLAAGKLPSDSVPKPEEQKPSKDKAFRDIDDASLKGTVQAITYGKGKIPPPVPVNMPPSSPAVPPNAGGPNATMAKQGTAPNLSTEGTWGNPPGQDRWSR